MANEIVIKGTDPAFKVVWNCQKQKYIVYKDGKYLISAFKFDDVKSYL